MKQHGYDRVLGPDGALHYLSYSSADEPQSCRHHRTDFGFWAFSKVSQLLTAGRQLLLTESFQNCQLLLSSGGQDCTISRTYEWLKQRSGLKDGKNPVLHFAGPGVLTSNFVELPIGTGHYHPRLLVSNMDLPTGTALFKSGPSASNIVYCQCVCSLIHFFEKKFLLYLYYLKTCPFIWFTLKTHHFQYQHLK